MLINIIDGEGKYFQKESGILKRFYINFDKATHIK
jgi:hypothetical protein